MRYPHTHFTKGKRLRVKLKSGEVFFDHFEEHLSRYVRFRVRGKVPTKELANLSIAKGE